MSRHEGVSCDSCLKSNFHGRRYKCLICYDYDLCADCYEEGVTSTRHLVDHPMQCILTRSDVELYFGGEMLNTEQPQSFTCPYCKKMGFSDAMLLEHVSTEHTETSLEVVCPLCAGLPGGEPNLVTDDFAGHLSIEHRTAIRHGGGVRRIPGRTIGGGSRARRSNMHFSSSSGISSLSPSGRESVDPIAELLSQLSGVRRSGGAHSSQQLQQLQMQIQIERQQVMATRQQLERLPRRGHQLVSSSNSSATMAEVVSGVGSGGSNNVNGNGSSGGACRTTEWSVSTLPQSQPSNLTTNVLNTRETGGSGSTVSVNVSNGNMLAMSIGCSGAGAVIAPGVTVTGGQTTIVGGALGDCSGIASGGSATGGSSNSSQSQYSLAKLMQPILSEEEIAEIGRERANRSQFVQALLLSTLASSSLDVSALEVREQKQQPDAERNRSESQETTFSDSNVNIENNATSEMTKSDNGESGNNGGSGVGSTDTNSENTRKATELNIGNNGVNAVDAEAQTATCEGRQQVNQQQQTSPDDFNEEYNNKQQLQQHPPQQQQHHHHHLQQQQQQQQQSQMYSNKKKSVVVGSNDRSIERRSRPPPAMSANTAIATSSQPPGTISSGQQQQQQHQQQQQQQQQQTTAVAVQKYKQNVGAATTVSMSASNANPIPDTR